MQRFRKQLARPLLLVLLLVLGPLNAQAVFACSLMGGAVFETCCCDDDETVDATFDTERDPCCEKSVTLVVDPDAPNYVKPIDVRSDVDPPPLIAAIGFAVSPRPNASLVSVERNTTVFHHCSDTYLTTQRLRL